MLSKPHNIIMSNIDILIKKYLPYIAVLLMGSIYPLVGQAQIFDERKSYFAISYDTLDLKIPDMTLTNMPAEDGEDITVEGKEYLDMNATGYSFTYGRKLSEKLAMDFSYTNFGTSPKENENTEGQEWGTDQPVKIIGKYSYTSYGVGYRFYFPLRNSEYTTKWFFRPSFNFWSSSASFKYFNDTSKAAEETTQDNDGTVLDLQLGIQARLNDRIDTGWVIHHNKNNSGASVMIITKF